MGAVRIALPPDVAAELVAEGQVVPSVMTRGVGDVVQVVLDATDTGANVVTVAAAAAAMPTVMRRVAARLRSGGPSDEGAASDETPTPSAGGGRVVLRTMERDLVVDLPEDLSLDDVASALVRSFAEASESTPT